MRSSPDTEPNDSRRQPSPLLPERGTGDRHDVRVLEEALGERGRVRAAGDADEREEPAAGRRPLELLNRGESVSDELSPPDELAVKAPRVVPLLCDGSLGDHLRDHRRADDHRVLNLGGLLADRAIGQHEADAPSHHRERLRERADDDDVAAPAGDGRSAPVVGVVDELHVGLVADDEDVAVGELRHDALAMSGIDGAPVGLLGLHRTTARVRGVSAGAMSSHVRQKVSDRPAALRWPRRRTRAPACGDS